MEAPTLKQWVYWLVWNIPSGKCISYGDLAAYAGKPQAARIVGGIAHTGPSQLPWHRVVRKDGTLAEGFPGGAGHQRHLLEAEGVEFQDRTIVLSCWWKPEPYLYMPLVVIVGETGSGKSSIALAMARELNGSIIAADSWTVRKRLDIGTAKPTKAEMKEIPHYVIDIVNPTEDFSAPAFVSAAANALNIIADEQKAAIMVGGTGLYVDSLLQSYSFLDNKDQTLRKILDGKSLQELMKYAKDHKISLGDIDTNNKRRVIRAIENNGEMPTRSPVVRPNTIVVGIRRNPSDLKERVISRVDAMFAQGLQKEVESLVRDFGWDTECLKGIGYSEFRAYLEGTIDEHELKQQIVTHTLQYAKRQRTWFKQKEYINWVETTDQATELIRRFCANSYT